MPCCPVAIVEQAQVLEPSERGRDVVSRCVQIDVEGGRDIGRDLRHFSVAVALSPDQARRPIESVDQSTEAIEYQRFSVDHANDQVPALAGPAAA
jgi:hypothetical protein